MKKKALMTASVASMIDLFNMDNIHLLQSLGYEVHVAANFAFGSITSQERVDEFRTELEQDGIKTYQVPIPRSIFDWKDIMISYRLMKKLCEEERYDLIHTQSPIGGVVARMAAAKHRKKGTKVIYTAHGFHFFKGASLKNWLLFYPIEKFFSRYTDVLITINQEDYARANKFHAKRVAYVPGIGIDLEKFAALTEPETKALRAELGFSSRDYVLLSLGQLSHRKNQETMIRAMAQIEDKAVRYLLVGAGELEKHYRALITELHLENRVILAGYRRDIPKLLHMADCFVFPSRQEGLPVSLMEAMAAGVPVICSNIRGNTDLVTDRQEGILVDAGDVEGFADAIMEMKRDGNLAERCRRQAGIKIREFGRETVQECMREIYG